MEGLKEREINIIGKATKNTIYLDMKVNKEEVEDTITEIKEALDTRANITIRNNQSVYVTINNFSETKRKNNLLETEIKG